MPQSKVKNTCTRTSVFFLLSDDLIIHIFEQLKKVHQREALSLLISDEIYNGIPHTHIKSAPMQYCECWLHDDRNEQSELNHSELLSCIMYAKNFSAFAAFGMTCKTARNIQLRISHMFTPSIEMYFGLLSNWYGCLMGQYEWSIMDDMQLRQLTVFLEFADDFLMWTSLVNRQGIIDCLHEADEALYIYQERRIFIEKFQIIIKQAPYN